MATRAPKSKAAEVHGRGRAADAENEPAETADQIAAREASERDRALMRGGPGEADDERTEETREEERQDWQPFEYKGRKFATQEELTTYIDELDTRSRTPTQLPATSATEKPSAKKTAEELIDWDTEFYKDPKAAMGKFRQAVKAEVSEELRSEYQTNQVITNFWRDFYSENKDMVGKEALARHVFEANYDKIGNIPIVQARAELAAACRKQLTDWGVPAEKKEAPKHRTTVESGGTTTRAAASGRQNADKGPSSLSAVIKARQAARQAGNRTAS